MFLGKNDYGTLFVAFPGAVEMVKAYSDAFSLIERGYNLSNGKTNLAGFDDVQDFRWHWNLPDARLLKYM